MIDVTVRCCNPVKQVSLKIEFQQEIFFAALPNCPPEVKLGWAGLNWAGLN
jgi:hypothetical protein